MTVQAVRNMVTAFSVGYDYAQSRSDETEVREGESHLVASFSQIRQVFAVHVFMQKICSYKDFPFSFKVALLVLPAVSLPLIFPLNAIRQGMYPQIYKSVEERVRYIASYFPKELSARTVQVSYVLTEYFGKVLDVAMVVGSLFLMVKNERLYGAVVLSSLAYQKIDRQGYIPRKMSLFVETYNPFVVDLGKLLNGSLLGAFSVACYSSRVKNFMYAKADYVMRKVFNFKDTASLADIDIPLKQQKALSFPDIKNILEADAPLQMNYAHCSKMVSDHVSLNKSRDFNQLQVLFDSVDWNYKLVNKKCRDDERFIAHIAELLDNTVTPKQISSDFEKHLNLVLQKIEKSEQTFVMGWFKIQMPLLVSGLIGSRPVEGAQEDLDDAIKSCEKILPYLLAKQKKGDRAEVEDILLALTVEGGGYCARAIKRVSGEMLQQVIYDLQPQQENTDPTKALEGRVYQVLEQTRLDILQKYYQELTGFMPRELSQDIHFLDSYRNCLLLGFVPFTQHERYQIYFMQLATYWSYQWRGILPKMFSDYRDSYDQAVKASIGTLQIFTYINQMLQQNPQLDTTQRNSIIEIYTERNASKWTAGETDKRFRRLLYVMLGILNPPAAS